MGRMGGNGAPSLFERMMSRLGRRLEFGSSALFFARMGLADPWSTEGALDEEVNDAGLRFVFLDGSPWLRRLLNRRGGAARGALLHRLERGAENEAFAHQAWADSAWRGGEVRWSAYSRLVRDALLSLVPVPATDGNVEVVSYSEDGLRMVFTRPIEADALPDEARPLAHARNRRRIAAAPPRARKPVGLRPVTERSPLVARASADREADREAETSVVRRSAARASGAASGRSVSTARVAGRAALNVASAGAVDSRRASSLLRTVDAPVAGRRGPAGARVGATTRAAARAGQFGRGIAASPMSYVDAVIRWMRWV